MDFQTFSDLMYTKFDAELQQQFTLDDMLLMHEAFHKDFNFAACEAYLRAVALSRLHNELA